MKHRFFLLLGFSLLVAGTAKAQQLTDQHRFLVNTPETALSYEVFGNTEAKRPPVIVVNGGPGERHDYATVNMKPWQQLAKERAVVFYDQRGLGLSRLRGATATAKQDLDAQVGDLEAIRANLHADHIIVMGHSFGGLIAMGYALRYPQHTAKLVLVDSASPKYGEVEEKYELFNDMYPDLGQDIAKDDNVEQAAATPAGAATVLKQYLSMLFYSPANRESYLQAVPQGLWSPELSKAVDQSFAKVDLWPQLADLHVPTLLIWGRHDFNVAPIAGWRIHKAIAGSTFVFFEQSGHLPFYEEPENFASVVEEFLNDARTP